MNNYRPAVFLAAAVFAFTGTAHAVTIQLGTTVSPPNLLAPIPASMNSPGQAVDMLEIGIGPTSSSYLSITDCALAGLTGCTQSAGGAAVNGPQIPYLGGTVATTRANAGSDLVSVTTAIDCPLICSSNAFVNAYAMDLQQLTISDGTGTLGSFVDIDVTFSMLTQFINNSSVPALANQLLFGAGAQVWIGDPSTYVPPTSTAYGRLSAPFLANTSATAASPFDFALGAVQIVPLEINRPYWVGLVAGTGLGLTPGDYTGLNVTLSAFVDPSFAIDAGWAASNSDVAQRLTIERTLNAPATVPEPATTALLAAGLAVLFFFARRRTLR